MASKVTGATCRHKYIKATKEVEITSPTGTTIIVPAERLAPHLRNLANATYAAMYRSSFFTIADMKFLLSQAD